LFGRKRKKKEKTRADLADAMFCFAKNKLEPDETAKTKKKGNQKGKVRNPRERKKGAYILKKRRRAAAQRVGGGGVNLSISYKESASQRKREREGNWGAFRGRGPLGFSPATTRRKRGGGRIPCSFKRRKKGVFFRTEGANILH